ncbi:MAG: hypothetical protein JXB04_11475 [Kiritimatiellae bacterium]|nr:hypothetical protein [Kiritimatiellia bacterium]
MRTTLVIPDPIYERSREEAERRGCNISELFTEAVEHELLRSQAAVREKRAAYRVQAIGMGKPQADLANREELYRTMEE